MSRACQQFACLPVHLPPVECAKRTFGRVPHENVFSDGEFGKQQQFLIDGRDTGFLRVNGSFKGDRVAIERDFACIRPVDAGNQLDQGRFAGAIFAQERVHFTGLNVETHIIQGFDTWKRLADMFERQDGAHR